MKSILIIALICFTSTMMYGQESVIVWTENKTLDWNDFSGNVNDSSRFDAEAFAEVRYMYTFNNPKDFHFDVIANFNKNTSWSRKTRQSQDLLKHEQLHFDIAEIYARKIKEIFNSYKFSDNFAEEVECLFNEKKLEYHAMQVRYDEETNHSVNKDKQKEWESYVREELNRTKQTEQMVVK